MLPFYGRRVVKGTKESDIKVTKDSPFFLFDTKLECFLKSNDFLIKKKNLEIGFGNGENVIYQAQKYKEEIFLVCDPFLTGCVKLVKKIKANKIKNIFVSSLDFFSLFEKIKYFTFSKIFILFPDPWPKKRHSKRKLVDRDFVEDIEFITEKNSQIIFASDNHAYQEQAMKYFSENENFINLEKKVNITKFKNIELIETKYYKKALKNKIRSVFFIFNRR